MVFGHQKCFGWYRVLIESPEGVPGSPGRFLGLMGQKGKSTPAHKGLVRPSTPFPCTKGGREGKGRRPKAAISLSFPPHVQIRKGGAGQGKAPRGAATSPRERRSCDARIIKLQ